MMNCPVCAGQVAVPVTHVRWGGFLAARWYRLVRCTTCGSRFSASSGRHEGDLTPGYLRGVLAGLLLVLVATLIAWRVYA